MLVYKDGHDGSVDHTQALHSIDFERRAHDTFVIPRPHGRGASLVIVRDGGFANGGENVGVALDRGSWHDLAVGGTVGVFSATVTESHSLLAYW